MAIHIYKYNFFLRRRQEIEYGKASWNKIINIKPNVLICVNIPLDALKILVEESKNVGIPTILWVQDIYSEAIKKILSKKISILSRIFDWHYSRIEKYCVRNSNRVIFITHRFKKYFKNSPTKQAFLQKKLIPSPKVVVPGTTTLREGNIFLENVFEFSGTKKTLRKTDSKIFHF